MSSLTPSILEGFTVPDLIILYHFTSKEKAIVEIRNRIEQLTRKLGEVHKIIYMVHCTKRPGKDHCLNDLESYLKVLESELALARKLYYREYPNRKRKRVW